jgi:hypothetical protein
MAAGQRRLGLARQARIGIENLWLAGKLSPSERQHKLREVDDASARFDALVEGVVQRGRLKGWNARSERTIRSAEEWADAFSMMLDFRNIYERIYRGAPAYIAPTLSGRGHRELAEHCKRQSVCAAPCKVGRAGLLRKKRCRAGV